ncbi:PA14 domain-containing protein [Streptomyces sp. STR69]|uniref:PA14 domain-containing protein n=1 Tax=Streptomyces sp. STR69 TaxID=1796942 RepID=UPI0021C78DC6|nr:PA14 domain-containing protein [Streptomyces sp. STR69]
MTRARHATATAVALSVAGGLLGGTAASASAAATCNSPVYKRQFFANTTFKGTPKKTDCDNAIDQNWTGAPATSLPKDNFAVRWSVTRDFGSGGPFSFAASAQDGIRVYLDGSRKINLWKNISSTAKKTVNLTVPSGKHTLRVDYVNWTGKATVKFAYTPRTAATVDKVKPLAPAGTAATYDTPTQQARLTWRKNVEMDLGGYRVSRRVTGTTGWQVLRDLGATATSYADTPPATGETYEYLVRSYDKARNYSAATSTAAVTSLAVTAPTAFTATGTDTGIALRWDPVPGAVKYRVVRYASSADEGAIWNTTGTSMTDTRTTRSAANQYHVAALDASGRFTAYSTSSTARRLVAAPTIGQVFPQAGAVTVTWDTDRETGGSYMGFRIYRATGTSTDWVEVTERCGWTRRTLADGNRHYLCTDWSAGRSTTYRYAVSGYDSGDKEGLRSGESATGTTGTDRQAPTAPASLTATVEDWGTVLTWSPVTDADLDRYTVWRGTTVDGTCTAAEQLWYTSDLTVTSWQDTDVADGEHLCYAVRPADFAQNVGAGTTVHLTEHDLRPTVETPAGATHGAYASLSGIGSVQVHGWSPAGTEEYQSFRATRWNPRTATFDALDYDPLYGPKDVAPPTGTSLWYQVVGVREDGTVSLPVLVSVAVPPAS